jgi:uncharacterized protein
MFNATLETAHTEEVRFAGDGVALAGQIDFPDTSRPVEGYPLIFVLHHAGYNTREAYAPYSEIGRTCGYAVFTWDKRGTGRSGASGKGSTTRDALHAYHAAVSHHDINPQRIIIVAVGAGTTLLGAAFNEFAHLQRPAGVILAGNMLDPQAVLAINAPVQIIVGENDWTPWQLFGKAAAKAHNAAYPHGAAFYLAECADRTMTDVRKNTFSEMVGLTVYEWLMQR